MPYFLEDVLKEAKRSLREAGITSWALDADVLMAHVLELRREQLITKGNYVLSHEEVIGFKNAIEKRRKLMPVSYITNTVEFMGLDFYVDENVLLPRPDTEILVEAAIAHINESGAETVLDMCSGSGAIAVSIAHYCQRAKVTAADISGGALAVAARNSDKNSVDITFVESDMFKSITGTYDVIVSNPPYISGEEMRTLPPNVIDYEPHMALYGGEDGLLFYKILAGASDYLNSNGIILVEIGADQKNDVIDIFHNQGFYTISALKDLAGLDRTLIFGKNIGCSE